VYTTFVAIGKSFQRKQQIVDLISH